MYDMIVIFAFNLKFTSCQPDRRSVYFLHRREGNQKLCTISFSIHPKNESLGSPDSANYFKLCIISFSIHPKNFVLLVSAYIQNTLYY